MNTTEGGKYSALFFYAPNVYTTFERDFDMI